MIEVRIKWDNFFLRSLDYDPEMSVLFRGAEGSSGKCDSDDYDILHDYIFWSSLSCVILALCCILLILLFSSTSFGARVVRGRDKTDSVIKRLERRSKVIQADFERSTKSGDV